MKVVEASPNINSGVWLLKEMDASDRDCRELTGRYRMYLFIVKKQNKKKTMQLKPDTFPKNTMPTRPLVSVHVPVPITR